MNGIHFDLKERTDMDFSFLKKVLLEDATPHQQMDLSSDRRGIETISSNKRGRPTKPIQRDFDF
jgi:hypothetical protein